MACKFAGATAFYHKASNHDYQPRRREDRFFLRRYQDGPGGEPPNALENEIHYARGPGNHSKP